MHGHPAFLLLLLDVVAELRVHERLAVAESAALAVFGPKQFLRHAVPKQLLADVLEVYRVARVCRFPVGEERLLDCRVVHAFGMRSVDPGRVRRLHDTFHCVPQPALAQYPDEQHPRTAEPRDTQKDSCCRLLAETSSARI